MTSIRESLRRLLGQRIADPPDEPRPYYSYRIYWAKMVRDWPLPKRREVADKLTDFLQAEDFVPNPLERRYRLAEVDSNKHAGASLLALDEVLRGFEQFEDNQKE